MYNPLMNRPIVQDLIRILALGIGFLGVVSVVLNGQNPFDQLNDGYVLGSLVILLGALIAAVNKIYARDLVRKYDGLYVTFFSISLGSVFLAALVASQSGFAELPEFSPQVLLSLLAIGITGTAIPWVIWGSSLKHLDVHVAASFNLLIPVFAALYSLIFFDEQFTLWILAGMLLTSLGVYLVQRDNTPSVPQS